MDEKKSEQLIAAGLIVCAALMRLLPHVPNFTPLTAIAVFSGAVLSPGIAIIVPVAAMIASDLLIGPHPLFWLTWGCFALSALSGIWVRRDRRAPRILAATLGGSVLFFVATNLGTFFFGGLYEQNFPGLAQCFTLALPFFRNALAGDFFYAALIFGVFELARRVIRRRFFHNA